MLKLEHITKQFGTKVLLKDINATINAGDFIILVGANGSGKSTLFNLISGALKPEKGKLYLHTQSGTTNITHTNEIFRTQWIAQLFQNPHVNTIDNMSVGENISLALMKGKTVTLCSGDKIESHTISKRIAQEYGIDITPLLTKQMSDLSGGQRQLIAFIMATINRPSLLLLDEPTAALDPQAATTLLHCAHRFIKEHNMTAILVTHDPELALTLGNILWLIKDGTLHQFNANEKKKLSPADLIGHIDYTTIVG